MTLSLWLLAEHLVPQCPEKYYICPVVVVQELMVNTLNHTRLAHTQLSMCVDNGYSYLAGSSSVTGHFHVAIWKYHPTS